MLSTWWIKNPFLKNKIIDVCLNLLEFVLLPDGLADPLLLVLCL
jgi:hypothetical protein